MRAILLTTTGEAKRAVLAAPDGLPVARLLALGSTVHWSPDR